MMTTTLLTARDLAMGGGVIKIPVADAISIGAEASFYYRKLYDYSGTFYSDAISEMAVCVPITVQYTIPTEGIPLYVAGGLQVDIPIGSKREFAWASGGTAAIPGMERAVVDVGILIGAGYMLTSNFGFDARYVFNFNEPMKIAGNSGLMLMSYGVGAFMYF